MRMKIENRFILKVCPSLLPCVVDSDQ